MLIRNGLQCGALNGFRVKTDMEPLTHLFFADNSVLFGKASVEEAQGIMDVLKTYARGLGQEINLSKSSIFFGTTTLKRTRLKIGNTMGIQCKAIFWEVPGVVG